LQDEIAPANTQSTQMEDDDIVVAGEGSINIHCPISQQIFQDPQLKYRVLKSTDIFL
jgi:hypothetical protein